MAFSMCARRHAARSTQLAALPHALPYARSPIRKLCAAMLDLEGPCMHAYTAVHTSVSHLPPRYSWTAFARPLLHAVRQAICPSIASAARSCGGCVSAAGGMAQGYDYPMCICNWARSFRKGQAYILPQGKVFDHKSTPIRLQVWLCGVEKHCVCGAPST